MDRARFFAEIRKRPFDGRMTADQVAGVEAILDAWERHAPASDPRFVAYSFGTTFHETAQTMQPIREYGRGKGRAYGATDPETKQAYYGRGFVQLTWRRNYRVATQRLRALGIIDDKTDLERKADLAMRLDIAAAILVFGMIEGWFTGRKLGQFFVGTRSDWLDARTIINGTDRAARIAAHSLHFYAALRRAGNRGGDE